VSYSVSLFGLSKFETSIKQFTSDHHATKIFMQ